MTNFRYSVRLMLVQDVHGFGGFKNMFKSFTIPETNIAPENGWLEY